MQTAIAFIVIFGSLVFFHELGHFLFAKRAGIMVREFAIGMGPKIFGMTKGETVYTLRLLPIGGYVRMAGDDLDSVELQPGYRVGLLMNEDNVVEKIVLNQNSQHPNILFMEVERADLEHELWIEGYDEDENLVRYNVSRTATIVENGKETMIAPYDRTFNAKTVGQRSMAIFAGPLFNFILAFFLFLMMGLLQGVPTNESLPKIAQVADDGVASAVGLERNDVVTAIDGKSISTWEELSQAIQAKMGQPMQMEVNRDGQLLTFELTPRIVQNDQGEKVGQIGIYAARAYEKSPIKAVAYAGELTYETATMIFKAVIKLVTAQLSIDELSGPVGIYKYTEEATSYGIFNLMFWAGALSMNLGIMNLLPLPALDGGRLLFFGFEALRGKPIDRQKEGLVHFVGIVLLMILMIVVTWNDIQKFFF
ncbi:RIP metalloprotease RseP [Metasolibacillus sp. FSL H7-0170]|uniref:RIP metalloprotease RseP n=1 Tax=Metasolibacillus TaxID=2703677 RepID=UPI000D35016E|nr:RIP metalloprotease RseP [Metasolibacillus fluoroglycofenilyticus]